MGAYGSCCRAPIEAPRDRLMEAPGLLLMEALPELLEVASYELHLRDP